MTRCELCGRLLDPTVFHDDTPDGGQVCERCCELCNQGKEPAVNDDDMVELTVPDPTPPQRPIAIAMLVSRRG